MRALGYGVDLCQNYALFQFDMHSFNSNDSNDTAGDLLILNLVTRNKFWMRSKTVETEIKEKFDRVRQLNGFQIDYSRVKMYARNDRVRIGFYVEMNHRGMNARADIGRF